MAWFESLPPDLPEGRLMTAYNDATPVYWLSTRPTAPGEWSRWRARHRRTGLWPLLAVGVEGDGEPFGVDARYDRVTTVGQHDCGAVLAGWWHAVVGDEPAARLGYLDPIGARWPGLTPGPARSGPAAQVADQHGDLWSDGSTRLALVPAVDGADALVGIGWTGPLNHDNDTARFAAVLRDWQVRFGVMVVGLGVDTLHVSVAAPPLTLDQALRVTAEHFAFCPDEIWQSDAATFPAYANAIVGANSWSFWWD